MRKCDCEKGGVELLHDFHTLEVLRASVVVEKFHPKVGYGLHAYSKLYQIFLG
jgi:hypothetical protein